MVDLMSTAGASAQQIAPRTYEAGEGWPEPDARLLNGGPRRAPEFPLECFGALGPWLSDLAASKGAAVDYVAVPLLAFAAGVVGSAREVELRPGWRQPCILWVASVGNPSCGKSPTLAVLKRGAAQIERELAGDLVELRREHEARKMDAQAAREKWEAGSREAAKHGRAAAPLPAEAEEPAEPQAPRLVVADATTEKLARLIADNERGVISVRDELAGLLGNFGKYGGVDEPFYLSAYDGDFSPVDRQKGGTINAARANLSLVGGIQPDKFQALLYGRANDGLVSRFLPVWPDPKPRKWDVPPADEGRALKIFRRLRTLQMDTDTETGERVPRVLRLTPEAESIFAAWYLEQSDKIDAAGGFLSEFLGKSLGACGRIALAFELLDWAAGVNGPEEGPASVSARAVRRACEMFADYFEPMALRVYADAALPEAERKAVGFVKELQKRNVRTFNARQAQREWGVSGVSTAEDMRAVCEVLAECDCIREAEQERAEGKRGRKQISYVVNPRLLKGRARA